jgi:hypothetical protein
MKIAQITDANKRKEEPRVLTVKKSHLAQIEAEPQRTMVILAMCLGLRCSELIIQQVLMRHADIGTTINIYGDAVPENQRKANRTMSAVGIESQPAPTTEVVMSTGVTRRLRSSFDYFRSPFSSGSLEVTGLKSLVAIYVLDLRS